MKNTFLLQFSVSSDSGRKVYQSEFSSPYEGLDWFLRHAKGQLASNSEFSDKALESNCHVFVSCHGVEFGVFKFDGNSLVMF